MSRTTSTARRRPDPIALATWLVVAAGIALRAVAYLGRSTLWLDEAATARNIVERSLADLLLRPLDYGQAAPKGFLLIEWLVTRTLGTSELAFRLVPFVAGVAALLAFRAIARRVLTPVGALVATLFFAVSYWFIVYSSDTHPYPLDIALSLGALLGVLVLRERPDDRRLVWTLAIAGAVGVWCSNGLVLTLFGLGTALGVLGLVECGWRDTRARYWPIAVAWGTSALAAVWVASHGFSPRTAAYFDWLWAPAMVPAPRHADSALWLWRAWRRELALWHGWNVDDPLWTSLYVVLALLGFANLLRRRWKQAVLAGSIVASYVIVSMAKQYPYDTRFVLAPIAVFVLGIGEAVGAIAGIAPGGVGLVAARALAVLLCVPPVYRVIAYPPPYQWSVIGAYLAQIRARWQPGDVLYAAYGSSLETAYHAPRFGIASGATILGPCDFTDLRTSLRAADALRGRRAWVIVGTGQFFPLSPEYGYLRRIGRPLDSLGVTLPGSIRQGPPQPYDIPTAYLFDLSDSSRLARATADTYLLSPVLTRSLRRVDPWTCYGVNAPMDRGSQRP